MLRFEKIAAAALSASMLFASGIGVFAYDVSGSAGSSVSGEIPGRESGKVDKPGMEKKIVDGDGNSVDNIGTIKPGEPVKYKLTSNVPGDLYTDREFVTGEDGKTDIDPETNYILTIHDKMSDGLSLSGDPVVKIADKVLDADWVTVTRKTAESNPNEDGCTFEIKMDLVALYNADVITDEDVQNASEITVEYTAVLAEGATTGAHTNQAWVDGNGKPSSKPEVEVDLFGIEVTKVKQGTKEVLKGAQFKLEKVDGDTRTPVVVDGNTVLTATDGTLTFSALTAGTYELTEVKAPAGYVRTTSPVEITLNKETAAKAGDPYVFEYDFENTAAPETGGTGTLLFTLGGAALLATAGVCKVLGKKEEE